MRLDTEVDWEKTAVVREFTPLPPNEYICLVTKSEEPVPEPGKGQAIVITAEVQEGEHQGRVIMDYIYPKKKDGGVNKIAMGQIKEWALATVGQERLSSSDFDTKEFEGASVRITTGIDSYQADNPDPSATPGSKISKAKTTIKKVVRA